MTDKCPECDGIGLDPEGLPCDWCGGSGTIIETTLLEDYDISDLTLDDWLSDIDVDDDTQAD